MSANPLTHPVARPERIEPGAALVSNGSSPRPRSRVAAQALHGVQAAGFAELGLRPELLRSVADEGYTRPTPIQGRGIPLVLAGRDVLGVAQTGTGKTAAFALPLLQRLHEAGLPRRARSTRALILTPTRELALQVGESFETYGRHLNLRSAVIFGGVRQEPQVSALQAGLDVLVATPGRLLDLLGQGFVALDEVEAFVLDEADRMLDMGFLPDVRRVLRVLPQRRQSLFFSATMPEAVAQLAAGILRDPARIDVDPQQPAVERIEQSIVFAEKSEKQNLLRRMLGDEAVERALVFTRTKHGANRVVKQLGETASAEALHGNKSQNARQRALENFRSGRTRVLVATDIAARGIDVEGITHVFNFDLPNEPESYVHRIGRTARAGASGQAISLCQPDERPYLRAIERLLDRRLPTLDAQDVPGSAAAAPSPVLHEQAGLARPESPALPQESGSESSSDAARPKAKAQNRASSEQRCTRPGPSDDELRASVQRRPVERRPSRSREMSKKLFVGGLSWNTNDDGLRQAFERFGEVTDAKVITDRETGRSRGFGFVTYTQGEDADRAIEEMNGSELDGRTLNVNEARDRERDGGSRGGGGGRGGYGGGGGRGGYGGGGGGGRDRW